MSAIEGKADIPASTIKGLLMTHSGHAQSMCAMPAKHPKRKTSSVYHGAMNRVCPQNDYGGSQRQRFIWGFLRVSPDRVSKT
jgi:hypothetical protein